MKQVDTETLGEWLENGRPVTVLDIRTPEDRSHRKLPAVLAGMGTTNMESLGRTRTGRCSRIQCP